MASAVKTVRKVRGEVRRDQIVQAALKIIGEKGVGSLRTAAIAREVGTSEANLYRHFKNKEMIYSAAVDHVRDMITRNIEMAFSGGASPLAKLKRFFALQIGLMERNSGIPRFMFSEELHRYRVMRKNILQTMYAVSNTLGSLIRDGQKAGSLRKDIDAKTTSLMLIGIVQGLTFRWSLSEFSFSLAAEGKKTWRNFEKCIASCSRTSSRSRKEAVR